jgi:hypothetical protein
MTRSHILLHCSSEELVAARVQAWGNIPPSGVRVLLTSPRWGSRLLHFLELSGVGRRVEDGSDEDASRAARTDGWVVWEDRGRLREPD